MENDGVFTVYAYKIHSTHTVSQISAVSDWWFSCAHSFFHFSLSRSSMKYCPATPPDESRYGLMRPGKNHKTQNKVVHITKKKKKKARLVQFINMM